MVSDLWKVSCFWLEPSGSIDQISCRPAEFVEIFVPLILDTELRRYRRQSCAVARRLHQRTGNFPITGRWPSPADDVRGGTTSARPAPPRNQTPDSRARRGSATVSQARAGVWGVSAPALRGGGRGRRNKPLPPAIHFEHGNSRIPGPVQQENVHNLGSPEPRKSGSAMAARCCPGSCDSAFLRDADGYRAMAE
jgi:hypothetical protein